MKEIKLNNIIKTFSVEDKQFPVLKGLSLSIPDKKITVLLGKSGCGKTTLLRLIANLEEIDSGSITYSDTLKTAFVFQEPRLMPWLNVYKNVAFGLNKNEITKSVIEKYISMVNLLPFKKAYPHQLSGGMQQRVAIARALAYSPDFIMMDEPFAALDYFTREQMQKELINLQVRNQISILFVTHSIDEALLLGDQIVIIENGIVKSKFEINENKESRNILDNKFLKLRMQILSQLENK